MRKRIISIILSIVIFTTFTPFPTTKVHAASNEEIIFNFCINELHLNVAAACGILANIEKESSFVADKLEGGYTWASGGEYGICQKSQAQQR